MISWYSCPTSSVKQEYNAFASLCIPNSLSDFMIRENLLKLWLCFVNHTLDLRAKVVVVPIPM